MIAVVSASIMVMGLPIADLQGEWCLARGKTLEPLMESWVGFDNGDEPSSLWRVRGTQIEWSASHTPKKAYLRVAAGPNAKLMPDPAGVRFVDSDGVTYRGTYSLKDGVVTLTLVGWVPIPGMKNTEGTRHIVYELVRTKPPKPPRGLIPIPPKVMDP